MAKILAMFVIDYDDVDVSGYEHIVADNAQEAVNEFMRYMPDTCVIDGVYKEVHNWRQRR